MYATAYNGGGQTGNYSIYKLSRAWIENEATWTNATSGQKWQNAGGDYVSSAIAQATCPRSAGKVWVKYNVLSAVNDFVRNPGSNFGFILINSQGSQEVDFPSSQYRNLTLAPKLTVTYTVPTAGMERKSVLPQERNRFNAMVQGRDLHLAWNNSIGPAEVTVMTLNGKCILQRHVPANGNDKVTGLCSGIYFVLFRNAQGQGFQSVSVIP